MTTSDVFWAISRGAGTTALVLSSVSVAYGLLMAGRIGKGNAADRRSYHEILSLSVMVAIAVHGVSLLGDSVVSPSLLDVTVPFAWSFETVATTLGIISGWALIALGLSFYVRDRIGRQRWRTIHMFTLLAWLGGLVHTLVEGSDAGQLWYLALVAITTAPVLVLLAMRVLSGAGRASAGTPGPRREETDRAPAPVPPATGGGYAARRATRSPRTGTGPRTRSGSPRACNSTVHPTSGD
jgi:sulfoxide reductase heme-binding subunit YedZ